MHASDSNELVTVTVSIPKHRLNDLLNFADSLRQPVVKVAAAFGSRPPSNVRAYLKDRGFIFDRPSATWIAEVRLSDSEEIKQRILMFGGKPQVMNPTFQGELLVSKNVRFEKLPLLTQIKMTAPYTKSEASSVVSEIFSDFSKYKNPSLQIARQTKSRTGRHFVLSNESDLWLPKKAVMFLALKRMNRIENWVRPASFTTLEATRFFNELGFTTKP